MADSVNTKPKDFIDRFRIQNLNKVIEDNISVDINKAVNDLVFEAENDEQSESVIKSSKPRINIIDRLQTAVLTVNNYEEVFCLESLQALEMPSKSDDSSKTIRYKDTYGTTVANVLIYHGNRIRVENFGNLYTKQDFSTPNEVLQKIINKANLFLWTTEDGGINQFDGNIETRYKDKNGDVMAAVITKPDGVTVDTIVEYHYKNGKKIRMIHTNQYGQSIIIYGSKKDASQKISFDIDTDGCVYNITTTLQDN